MTTLAEVKEQVLKYVPVMARPMVMYKNNHPIQWTGVYADVEVSFFPPLPRPPPPNQILSTKRRKGGPLQDPDDKPLWIMKLEKPTLRSKVFEVRGAGVRAFLN